MGAPRCVWIEYFKRPHTPNSLWAQECPFDTERMRKVKERAQRAGATRRVRASVRAKVGSGRVGK